MDDEGDAVEMAKLDGRTNDSADDEREDASFTRLAAQDPAVHVEAHSNRKVTGSDP
jgi:hypothetical protein